MNYLLVVFFLLKFSLCYLEQRLTRHAIEHTPSKTKVDLEVASVPKCPDELLDLKHNNTYVTQLCFQKDVFYNIEVMLGGDNEVFEMAIDLTSPWSWVKSQSCKQCPKIDPLKYEEGDLCSKKSKSCQTDDFTATFDSSHWQDDEKSAQIYNEEIMILGTFQQDDLKLMAYNSSNNDKLLPYIEAKLGRNETLDLVTISGLRMLNVRKFYGAENILSDGVIGLVHIIINKQKGFGFTETDDESGEPDTDFVEALVKQKTQLKLTRQQFAIYTLETGKQIPHYVIQFGGFDFKYAHEHTEEIIWVDRVPNSGYYWMLEVDSFYLKYLGQKMVNEEDMVSVNSKKAVLTLNSQFIELPKGELLQFLERMNSLNSKTDCHLVDEELFVVYCENLAAPDHFENLKITFRFPNKEKIEAVSLDSFLIYSSCREAAPNSTFQHCFLNIKLSRTGFLVLGEPFMRWHYLIFANEPNILQKVGILPAASSQYFREHPKSIISAEDWVLFKPILYIFLIGILMICCVANFKRCIKDFIRSFKYGRQKLEDDNGKLRVRQQEDDFSPQDFKEDYEVTKKELELQQQQKHVNEWQESKDKFNFESKFEAQVEDHSL